MPDPAPFSKLSQNDNWKLFRLAINWQHKTTTVSVRGVEPICSLIQYQRGTKDEVMESWVHEWSWGSAGTYLVGVQESGINNLHKIYDVLERPLKERWQRIDGVSVNIKKLFRLCSKVLREYCVKTAQLIIIKKSTAAVAKVEKANRSQDEIF